MFEIGFEEFVIDYFLPFILFFSLIYILLHQTKIFGDPANVLVRKTNAIIALLIGILVVWVNPFGIPFSLFISQLFSITTFVLLALVFLVFFAALISLAGGEVRTTWVSVMLGLFLVLLVFGATGILGYHPKINEIISISVVLLIIFGTIWWLFRPSS